MRWLSKIEKTYRPSSIIIKESIQMWIYNNSLTNIQQGWFRSMRVVFVFKIDFMGKEGSYNLLQIQIHVCDLLDVVYKLWLHEVLSDCVVGSKNLQVLGAVVNAYWVSFTLSSEYSKNQESYPVRVITRIEKALTGKTCLLTICFGGRECYLIR